MKCKQCECIFSSTYEKCPSCGSELFEPEKFKQQFMLIEEQEAINPFVVCSNFDDTEVEYEPTS